MTGEEIAKQLDFGHVPDRANGCSSSQTLQYSPDSVGNDIPNPSAEKHVKLHTVTCDSGSSSDDDNIVPFMAASARPSCRRRPALDSDSDHESVNSQYSSGSTPLPLQEQTASAYDFTITSPGSSRHASATLESSTAQSYSHMLGQSQSISIGAQAQQQHSGVIVLESSDDGDRRYNRKNNVSGFGRHDSQCKCQHPFM